ncbi:MAG: LamG domain-containing protein [Nitrospirae bacterium]|nr:LamG domain-containing protein [Nitrospirota bacterium]
MTISDVFGRNKYYIMFILAYIVITLSPLLNAGFYDDDQASSYVRGTLVSKGMQLNLSSYLADYINFSIDGNKYWIKETGRFFPLSAFPGTLPFYIFYSQDTVIFLNILKILSLCLNILLYGYLIWLITKSEMLSLLSMLLIPVFFQFRVYHDPILSYPFLLSFVLLYALLSLISLQQYLVKGKIYYLVLSMLLYLAGCLTYEISYLFFILHFILIYFQINNLKMALKQTSPFIIIVIFLGILSLFLRHNAPHILGQYTINLNFYLYFKTFMNQTLSSLPMSYIIFTLPNRIHHIAYITVNYNPIRSVISSVLFVVLLYMLFTKLSLKDVEHKFLIIFGSVLCFIPGLMIAASPKFQSEVTLGKGYLPVYIQYYGMLLLLTGAVLWLSKTLYLQKNRYLKHVLVIILAIVNFLNIQTNAAVIEVFNGSPQSLMGNSRMLFEHALKDDILANVPDGAMILSTNSSAGFNLFTNSSFFYTNMPIGSTRYQFHIMEEYNVGKLQYADLNKYILENKLYITQYTPGNPPKGYLLLAKVKSFDPAAKFKFIFNEPRVFTTISKNSENYVLIGTTLLTNTDGKQLVKYTKVPLDKMTCRKMDAKYCMVDDPVTNADYISIDLPRETISGSGAQNTQTNIFLDDNFTIELSVKPQNKQFANADIISNHPGFHDHEGFAIENADPAHPNNNVYGFGIGNGHEWSGFARFELTVNRWNHIAIVKESNKIITYLNGKIVAQQDIIDTIKNSEMPLIIGNWYRGDRPFNGSIGKFNILNVPLSENEVKLRYKSVLSII